MPQSENAGSISYKQEKLLKRLVDEIDSFDADWFDALKDGAEDVNELSAAEASEFITALLEHQKGGAQESTASDSTTESGTKEVRPVSDKQMKFLLDLLERKELAKDGVIDVDHWLSRLTSTTASHLIDAAKFTPDLNREAR